MLRGFMTLLSLILPFMLSCTEPINGSGNIDGETPASGSWDPEDVETYKYSSSIVSSRKYLVTVNGVRQTVYPTDEGQICTFGCDEEVQVKVINVQGFDEAVLRPLSKNYTYEKLDAQTIVFTARPYDRIVAEFDSSEDKQLFIFVNPKSETAGKPSKDDPDVIYYEAGKDYDVKHIKVPSGKTLYLEGGAVLNAKVYMQDSENCKVKGFGIVNGMDNGVEVSGVRVQNCSNVEISGVTILNNTGRVCFNAMSSNILIDNVKAIGEVNGDQTDAIDIYSCQDVVVKRCFAYGNDDTYCIKSWKWGYKGETKNVHFEDCIARNFRGNSFEIGYETGCGVSNVSYKDIYSIHSSGGSDTPLRRGAVTIHDAAAGHIHDITYENVYIEDPLEFGIDLRICKSAYELGTGEEWGPGVVDNVKMKNVYMLKQAPKGNTIAGYDADHKIEIEFENLYIAGKKITSAEEGGFVCSYSDVKFK